MHMYHPDFENSPDTGIQVALKAEQKIADGETITSFEHFHLERLEVFRYWRNQSAILGQDIGFANAVFGWNLEYRKNYREQVILPHLDQTGNF